MTDYEKYSLAVEILVALGTIAAVIMAIWGDRVRRLFGAAPKLEIALEEPAFNTATNGQDGWYYLISVFNKRQQFPAENVRLLLTQIHKKAPDGSWRERKFSGPTQVSWRWPNNTDQFVTVGPKETATFAAIMDGKPFNVENTLDLRLYHPPNNLGRYIRPKEPVRLTFQAVSDSAQSEPLMIEVAWNGEFKTGSKEMNDCCIVKPVVTNPTIPNF